MIKRLSCIRVSDMLRKRIEIINKNSMFYLCEPKITSKYTLCSGVEN